MAWPTRGITKNRPAASDERARGGHQAHPGERSAEEDPARGGGDVAWAARQLQLGSPTWWRISIHGAEQEERDEDEEEAHVEADRGSGHQHEEGQEARRPAGPAGERRRKRRSRMRNSSRCTMPSSSVLREVEEIHRRWRRAAVRHEAPAERRPHRHRARAPARGPASPGARGRPARRPAARSGRRGRARPRRRTPAGT